MTEPRAHKKCVLCKHTYREHAIAAVSEAGENRRECPDGSGRAFGGRVVRPGAASTSFSEGEIRAADTILVGLMQGKQAEDLAVVIRSPEFASLVRKIGVMRDSSKRNHNEADS